MTFHEPRGKDRYLKRPYYAVTVNDEDLRHQLLKLGFTQILKPREYLVIARSAFDTLAVLRMRFFRLYGKAVGRCPFELTEAWRQRRALEAA